jgi:hypothetical protein
MERVAEEYEELADKAERQRREIGQRSLISSDSLV